MLPRQKMPDKMSEERALLLTDLVDSTQLAESIGDAAAAELNAAHDRVARDLLRQYKGREIDKTDGMLMLFEAASDAAAYAVAYHAAVRAMPVPLKARAGLHVGPVILRANSAEDVVHGAKPLEVEGIAKPVAARIMSLALGGQTLLSAEARAALGKTPLRVQSHGHWRIKGIGEPVELFELGDEHAPFMPPPDSAKVYRVVRSDGLWLPLQQVRHNLPAERDAFVGREDMLVELARRFDAGARLVSLLGIGGTGKTRLALRFARTWLGDYAGGVWFCDLSQARDVDGLVRAVALALEVPLGKDDPVIQLGHAMSGRGRCLLILDNFEQIARHADETIGRWLDRAVEARFLVTTREVLGLPGEQALALAPMGMIDGCDLFVRRAQAARSDFRPKAEERASIQELVKLLDGLPLAIELAAVRVRVMPPSALLDRMGDRFRLLAAMGGRHDRQATLRTTFDWSWDLLSDTERSALAQLSVFEGGFSLAAAESVLELPAVRDLPSVLDALQSLVHKSLVQSVQAERFDLLVSVQEYASERLGEVDRRPNRDGEGRLAAQCRHGAYFAVAGAKGAAAGDWSDLDNVIVACTRAVARADPLLAVQLLQRAWEGMNARGPYQTAVELASQVLRVPELDAGGGALTHAVLGNALRYAGHNAQAYAQLELAHARSIECGNHLVAAQALRVLADIDIAEGKAEFARERLDAAMAIALRLNRNELVSEVHDSLGNLAQDLGTMDEARKHFEAALAAARVAADQPHECATLGNLAVLCEHVGQLQESLGFFEAAFAAAVATGNLRLQGNTLCNMGLLHQLLGDAVQARDSLERALSLARTLGLAYLECNVLCNLGIVLESLGQFDEAQTRFEAAVELARTLGDRHCEGQFLGYLGLLHARRSRHLQARQCLDAGQALLESVLDRIGLGVLLCSRAEAAKLSGDEAAAVDALDAAQRICQEIDAGRESEFGKALTRAASLLA